MAKQMQVCGVTVEQYGHQGDTQFYRIVDGQIPKGAVKSPHKKYIAESEQSGSRHAVCGDYDFYDLDVNGTQAMVLDVKQDCIINHTLREHLTELSLDKSEVLPKKDHEHSTLPTGVYLVGIHERFDPLAGFRAKVQD